MLIRLHKHATTRRAIRASIQSSAKPVAALARELGVREDTIRRWKSRTTVEDRPHPAPRLRTTLTPAQEAMVIALRQTLGIPLDDLLAVPRAFIHDNASRLALYRLLTRHRLAQLPVEPKEDVGHQPCRADEPGFVRLDATDLPPIGGEERRDRFVAIDRATRWVSVDVFPEKTAATAKRFLKNLAQTPPFRIRTLPTDHGKEFPDRLITRGERTPWGRHAFDAPCTALTIEHRLTRPRRPQTTGMVKRVNGGIADILATHHVNSSRDLEATLTRLVWLDAHHLPQKAVGNVPPIEAVKNWYAERPDLFLREPRHCPGPHIYYATVRNLTLANRHGPSRNIPGRAGRLRSGIENWRRVSCHPCLS